MPKNIALITGSAKRIGKEISLHLASKGFDIALHFNHSQEEVKEVQQTIKSMGRNVHIFQADLQQEQETLKLIANANKALGPITCLINNASVYENDTLESFTQASWDKHLLTNCFAPLLLAREFAKQLPKGEKGNVINLLDSAAIKPRRDGLFSYQISKAAFTAASELLATQLAPTILVNNIALGPILQNPSESAADFKRYQANCPLKKGAEINDILAALDYLLAAKSITGVTIPVDGGKWLK